MTKGIFIVEDDPDILWQLTTFLTEQGFKVTSAENGAVALKHLNQLEVLPGLILLDLQMPVMDGWEFRKQQKQTSALMNIPVVALTAMGANIKSIDTDARLKKPMDLGKLLETVGRYLSSV